MVMTKGTTTLSGELRWFLSCLDEDATIEVRAGEEVRGIIAYWQRLGDMAEAIERAAGSKGLLTLHMRSVTKALSSLAERDGAPCDIKIARNLLPAWRYSIGTIAALAAATERDAGDRIVFLKWRLEQLQAASAQAAP
jgi:hypothetical protein